MYHFWVKFIDDWIFKKFFCYIFSSELLLLLMITLKIVILMHNFFRFLRLKIVQCWFLKKIKNGAKYYKSRKFVLFITFCFSIFFHSVFCIVLVFVSRWKENKWITFVDSNKFWFGVPTYSVINGFWLTAKLML